MQIKRNFYWIITAVCLSACQSEPSKTSEETATVVGTKSTAKKLVLPWNVVINDSTHLMEIRKDNASNMTNLGAEDVIEAINLKHPQIKLSWVQQKGSKAFIKISDASYLTQQSGTQGAQAYLAEVTYSLTELQGIAAVDFSFEEGDHAMPGTYTREHFKDFN